MILRRHEHLFRNGSTEMRGSNAYLKLQTAFSMAQKAHTDGWEVAKASINSAAADFPTHFAAATEKAKEATAEGASWAREHPYKAAAYGTVGAVSLVTVAAPGAVAAPVLALGGFGSNGVIGGKLVQHHKYTYYLGLGIEQDI